MNESIMFIKEKLSQKFSFGKRFDKKSVKRLITQLVLLAFLNQNLAFATHSIIELDFEGSNNPQRLHTLLPSSKIQDVSHIEIDTEQKQATLYKKGDGEEVYPATSFSLPSVVVYQGDFAHNLWGLEQETIKLFLQANPAWLQPLDEDGYKLEFRGRLLGGMKKNNAGGGMNDRVKISIITSRPPNPDLYYHDMFRYISEMAQYQSEVAHMIAHNTRIDQEEKEEKEEKAKEEKQKKEKEVKEKLEIEKQRQEHPVFSGEYEHFKKIHHLAKTEKSYETVFKYSDLLGYDRSFVKSIDWKRPFSFTEYLQSYNPFYSGYEQFKQIHYLAGTEKSYETVFKYSDPLGYDRSFVKSIDWKSTYTFETYLQSYNPFYQDYSQIKEIHRLVNTVIYPEVFKYSSPLGYSEEFVKSIPYKEPMKPFEVYMTEVFDDQVLEDWGVKNWREFFHQVRLKGSPTLKDMIGLGAEGGGGGGFLGRRGFQLKNPSYQKTQNKPTVINEQQYSGHVLDQMRNRGIMPSVVEETIKNGKALFTQGNVAHIYDPKNNVSVIINEKTKNIITTFFGK